MNVCVAVEYRFVRLPDGSVWTPNQYSVSFWRRYLEVFDHVRCLARVKDITRLEGQWQRADGEAISFSALPHYIGPAQFLSKARRVRLAVDRSIVPGDAFVLRVPGNVGRLAAGKLRAMGYPYAVEVLGDPHDVFSPGAVRHPLRGFFRRYATRQLRLQCARACAVSYVTAQALQRRYPSSGKAFVASDVDLPDQAFAQPPRVFSSDPGPMNLIFVGSLEQYYKGPDLLIRAFARCLRRSLNLWLTIVGGGRYRRDLEVLATRLECRSRIRFTGELPGVLVGAELDKADLFVLPSRAEGLPRAMLEAMARGLPCIGTCVGGIRELLPPDAMVPREDAQALAQKIYEVLTDPLRVNRMSTRNAEKAKAYRSELLQPRRADFYRAIGKATEAWLRDHRARQ